MPLFSLILALATFFSAQGRRDTALVIPPSPTVPESAPADSLWQNLVELDRSHTTTQNAAAISALVGAGVITVGALFWTMDGLVMLADTTGSDGPLYALTAWTFGLGAACEVFAAGAGIYSMVLSHRIEAFEHRTRYRLSFQPILVPTNRAVGAVARVGF